MKVVAAKAGVTLVEFQQRVDGGDKWCYACRDWSTLR